MFLVLHDIYWLYCPSPCFTYCFPSTWDDSTISRNTETQNSFCFQFSEVFFVVCQFLDKGKKNEKAVIFVVMFSSKRLIFLFF